MTKLTMRDLFVFILGASLMGCAGWGYRVYGMDGMEYNQGILRATKAKDDIPFSQCKPDEFPQPDGTIKFKNKCAVIFIPELTRLKSDLEECQMRLTECERYKNAP